ncbi:hypothetical protein [Erythrobacter oryzae]|uniref:hypothetical protein n=1 Tax=Erythrobacter oryzae TaxID=3019556 RepID=UPI0025568F03|nr:hypothetical protein [Erythrobacter sp. COR-2]
MRALRLLAIIPATALIGAAPPIPRETRPGEGVLCIGTFIYFVEKTGRMCRPGEDEEFQQRIGGYAKRFDEYIIRNSGGSSAALETFKNGQNLDSDDRGYICEGDVARSYDAFIKIPREELNKAVDEILSRDGPPSFGDCV